MNPAIEKILRAIPDRVSLTDIEQRGDLDARVLIANSLYGDVVGVGEGFIEWFPNSYTPGHARLIWWWLVRPDLGAAIAYEAPEEIRQQIGNYVLEYSINHKQ